jgi:predicted anti-sigma-YlaC factor YlaD
MDCLKFQDSLSDYVEGALDSRSRAECAGHRLVCRDCRELYTDVRAMMLALGAVATDDAVSLDELNARILAATTAGEMLSCNEFDRLIERYFDGVLLAPTFQTFQAHFEKCAKCRRLMAGIEEAIEICHEIKETEVDAPPSLQDRILAATVGPRKTSLLRHWKELLFGVLLNAGRALRTPQWVAALLIFAAACLLIVSRFGSISAMANHATSQAGQLHQKMVVTSTNALNGLEHIEAFFSGEEQAKPPGITQPLPSPTPQPAAISPPSGDSQLQPPVRHALPVRRSRHRN